MEKLELCPIDNTYKIAESTLMIREAFDYVTTKRQFDLIFAIISMIEKSDDNLKTYVIPFKEIAKMYNLQNPRTKEIKKYVDEATNKIMDSHFQITEDDAIKKYHWVECCEINHKTKVVIFKLSDTVKKFYIEPADGFELTGLKIDGASVTPVESYTFASVENNHTIEATFTITQTKKMELLSKGYSWIDLKL